MPPKEEEIMMKPLDMPEIIETLCEIFDCFDEEEPMCSEARGLLRNEIVPQAKRLVRGLVDKGDLDAARGLVEMFETIRYFVVVNGPASTSDEPKDGLWQRYDLDEDEQKWRP
jgi:hypothetical protein